MIGNEKAKIVTALTIYLAKAMIKHRIRVEGGKPSSIMPNELSRAAKDIAPNFECIAEAAIRWAERKYQPMGQPRCLPSKPTRASASSARASS
jgi:hypothetical protein